MHRNLSISLWSMIIIISYFLITPGPFFQYQLLLLNISTKVTQSHTLTYKTTHQTDMYIGCYAVFTVRVHLTHKHKQTKYGSLSKVRWFCWAYVVICRLTCSTIKLSQWNKTKSRFFSAIVYYWNNVSQCVFFCTLLLLLLLLLSVLLILNRLIDKTAIALSH